MKYKVAEREREKTFKTTERNNETKRKRKKVII
jgi:hypothetical protein